MRWQPSLQVIPHYESEPSYISALIKSIEKKVQSINWKPDLIISSYHGIPRKYFDKGDPYHCYCHKTTRLIKEKYSSIDIETTFQSRFGTGTHQIFEYDEKERFAEITNGTIKTSE